MKMQVLQQWSILSILVINQLHRAVALHQECTIQNSCSTNSSSPNEHLIYGVDVSFPIHSHSVSHNYAWLPHNIDPEHNPTPKEFENVPVQHMGNRQEFYEEFMDGCRKKYPGSVCDTTEDDRIAMSLRQPQSMQNYTDLGFKKIRAPDDVFDLIKSFWEMNQHLQYIEEWPYGNTYTNHWKAPTYMLSIENPDLPGGGYGLKSKIWNLARSSIQEWTGQQLVPCSLYGIRIYKEGAVLNSHVDRLPLVSSAIINVAQDVEEDWPIEVYGHDGKAHNVTMQPGDMVLYESHSVVHGRPFSLKGKFYANIFIHFEPAGHPERHESKTADQRQAEEDDLPPYIIKGAPEEANWRKSHPKKEKKRVTTSNAHIAAAHGKLDVLQKIAEQNKNDLYEPDVNGWTPLHEAARGGHLDVVTYLFEEKEGRDVVNVRTSGLNGETPMFWADRMFGKDHLVVKYLESVGGIIVPVRRPQDEQVQAQRKQTQVREVQKSVGNEMKEKIDEANVELEDDEYEYYYAEDEDEDEEDEDEDEDEEYEYYDDDDEEEEDDEEYEYYNDEDAVIVEGEDKEYEYYYYDDEGDVEDDEYEYYYDDEGDAEDEYEYYYEDEEDANIPKEEKLKREKDEQVVDS